MQFTREEDWLALQVHPRKEFFTAAVLENKGYEMYAPLLIDPTRHSSTAAKRPLFPGYLFCRLRAGVVGPIVTTPGVMRIVGFGSQPARISADDIARVKLIEESCIRYGHTPYLRKGDWVQVENGPLAGLRGIFLEFKRQCKLVVSLHLLQRSVAVELDASRVRFNVVPGGESAAAD